MNSLTPYRVKPCRRCGCETLHKRPDGPSGGYYRGGDDALTRAYAIVLWFATTGCLMAGMCVLWPLVLLLRPLLRRADSLWVRVRGWLSRVFEGPYRCAECGRANRTPGGREVFLNEY